MTKPRRFTAVAHMWCEIRLGISMIARRGILPTAMSERLQRAEALLEHQGVVNRPPWTVDETVGSSQTSNLFFVSRS
jgi:hypothetical protein